MKKLLSCLLAVLLCVLPCLSLAASIDVASLTDDELRTTIDAAQNELARRGLIASGASQLFAQNGVSFSLTGNARVEYGELHVEGVLVNDSDRVVMLGVDTACVNGWTVFGYGFDDTPAGKRQQADLVITLDGSDAATLEDIKEIEITFIGIDSATIDTLFTTGPITFSLK